MRAGRSLDQGWACLGSQNISVAADLATFNSRGWSYRIQGPHISLQPDGGAKIILTHLADRAGLEANCLLEYKLALLKY